MVFVPGLEAGKSSTKKKLILSCWVVHGVLTVRTAQKDQSITQSNFDPGLSL